MIFVCAIFVISVFNVEAEFLTRKLTNEKNEVMMISSFGFLPNAYFEMNISFTFPETLNTDFAKIGLRFDKSSSGGRKDYRPMDQFICGPDNGGSSNNLIGKIEISRAIILLSITKNLSQLQVYQHQFSHLQFFENSNKFKPFMLKNVTSRSISNNSISSANEHDGFSHVVDLPVNMTRNKNLTLSTSLYFKIENENQSGLYELYLHNCKKSLISLLKIDILQRNPSSYLSAGDIYLPTMYSVMAAIIFMTTLFWSMYLWNKRDKVFTIHYLMALFMIIKTMSITFHAIDYYFIGRDGRQETWAVIFYIVHLLKGTLLFICLLLIGTGWAFIKYVLSDREKKLFMIVIPLQVVANIAYMIHEESASVSYNAVTWPQLMFLFDILCFGIILISVSWSIRHLQEASATDGKAAISVVKLRLFQQFYVMVICYLYFRRVLVYLLQITLPFHFTWIHNLFYEVVSLIFFIVTGYKFRPGCDNPYLAIPQVDEKEADSFALTESGLTETLAKVNQPCVASDDDDDDETVVLLQRNKTSFV